MNLQIFNTLTKQKEDFKTLVKGHVGMYVCGPTVSGESHLGHARPFITFDVIYRYLLHKGFKVRYVRNITDAGHFEEEGREGEDKINSKALIEKLEPMELVQKYTNLFHWAMNQFNCLPPSIEPTATGHIVEQIEMIAKIIELGFAYVVNGSVYFDVKKYNTKFTYGILSRRKIEELIENTRTLESQDEKKNTVDFALWKNAPIKHLMRWKSPWGYGFPGWHIECSAMSTKYLGKQFDIHGGGIDLQFPHHDCEIAQSSVCNDIMPAKYWLHNNMITINGKKMGKSYNNIIKFSELFTGSHPALKNTPIKPNTIRFFILQTQYRSTLDFSIEALIASDKAFNRLWHSYKILQNFDDKIFVNNNKTILDKTILAFLKKIEEDIEDDFNTAKVLASFFELILIINSLHTKTIPYNEVSKKVILKMKNYFKIYLEDILGLKQNSEIENEKLDKALNLLIELRNTFKANKQFSLSDKIRKELETVGIKLKDNKDGSTDYQAE